MLRFSLHQILPNSPTVEASFDNEPAPGSWLLSSFLLDMEGNEDLYLGEIAKAEAGETVLNLHNNQVRAHLYPDGRVILESMVYTDEDDPDYEPPQCAEFTLAEIKQLILDWLVAKKEWLAQYDARKAKPAPPTDPPGMTLAASAKSSP